VETFASVNARYVIARTHLDSASLANARGDRDATKKSLQSAYVVFVALNAPNLVARTEQLAVEYGIKLHDLP
jgi:hypothetical protein